MCIPVRARDRRQAIASIYQKPMAKRSGSTMAASLPTLGNAKFEIKNTNDDDGLLSSSLSQASSITSSSPSLSQVPSSSWIFKTPEERNSTRSLSVLSPPSPPNKRRRLDVDYNCKPICNDDESLFLPLLEDLNMVALKDKDMNAAVVPTFNLRARPTKLSIPPRKEAPVSTVSATASTNKNSRVGKIPLPTFEDGSSRSMVLKMECDRAITA